MARTALTALAAVLAAGARGQVDMRAAFDAVRAIRDNNGIGNPVQNPFSVPSGPGLNEKVPPPGPEANTADFHLIYAGSQSMAGDRVDLSDGVVFDARGYHVTCDAALGNRRTQVFTLRGHVRIDGEDFSVVDGVQVTVDFINKTYDIISGQAQLNPSLVHGMLKDKAYVKGQESYGSEHETTTLTGDLTTCNYPMPHYDIEADSIVLRPQRRVIFRKTRIRILGYTVLKLPFLSIPLNNRRYKNVPYVGKSPDEGYFIKSQYGIPLKNPNYNLETREDYMTKLGLGLGAGYEYASQKSAGVVNVYHIFGSSDDLTFSNTHHQVFSWGTLSIDDDYEKDNYLVAPTSTTFNSRVAINIPQGVRGSDRLTFTDSSSSAFGYSTSSQAFGLTDQRSFGPNTTTELDLNYFNSSSSFSSGSGSLATERLDVHFQAQQDLKKAVAAMQYQRSIPIGSSPSFVTASDETPMLSLQSDAGRLLGAKAQQEFPFTALLSWGDFQDPTTTSDITRYLFDLNFNRVDTSRSRFHTDVTGEFKQGFYSDGAAEYVETLGTNMRYDLGSNTGINLRYNYMEPFGYSPLTMDQTGKTDFISTDLNVRPIPSWLIGAQTGYDFLRASQAQIGWQQIGIRSEFQPEKWFLFRSLYTYDTYGHAWSTMQFDITYTPGATQLTVGGTYQGETHLWNELNLYLQAFKWGRMTMNSALSYNGYLHNFDSAQFSFTYDLHCAEAVFELQENNEGFRAGQQLAFFIRLKAFPYEIPFGVGTRGQPVGFNTTGTPF